MGTLTAKTPEQYLEALTPERRALLATVRTLVNDNLPEGYVESTGWGCITWSIPLSVYPDTYNGQPMGVAALASHKTTATLYLLGAAAIPELRERLERGFKAAGKRLDMGKSCVHFKAVDDLPLEVIGDVIAALPVETYIARLEAGKQAYARLKAQGKGGPARKKSARKTARPKARRGSR